MFDKDKNGKITFDEVKELLGSSLSQYDDEVWKSVLKEVDVNSDEEITYDEFHIMMNKFVDIKASIS